jgi:hypothetical protein
MAKMILLSRVEGLRLAATGWVGGFFLCRTLELRHASPHVQDAVGIAMAILSIVVAIGTMAGRESRFIDRDKDQLALIERLSAFLDRHHLWNRFLTEDTQNKR